MSAAVDTVKADASGAALVPRTLADSPACPSTDTSRSSVPVSTAALPPADAAPLTVAPFDSLTTLSDASRLTVIPSPSASPATTVCEPNATSAELVPT